MFFLKIFDTSLLAFGFLPGFKKKYHGKFWVFRPPQDGGGFRLTHEWAFQLGGSAFLTKLNRIGVHTTESYLGITRQRLR